MSQPEFIRTFEEIWAELKLLLDWNQGFGFYLVFSSSDVVARELKQRVQDATRLRSRALQWCKPNSPETAADEVVAAAFTDQDHYRQWQAPLWVELTAGPEDTQWQRARRLTLSALNRRRGQLERDCQRPFFLQLPLAVAPEIVTYAPDLWSVRQQIIVLPSVSNDGIVTAVAGDSPEYIRELSMQLDDTAAANVEAGDLLQALTSYRGSLKLAREFRDKVGDTPQALRDVSVSLNNVGSMERDSGNQAAALAAYRESLEISRQLRVTLGDTPQALRDVSVNLHLLAQAERSSGNPELADSLENEQQQIQALRGSLAAS